jgi:hypothetical protein
MAERRSFGRAKGLRIIAFRAALPLDDKRLLLRMTRFGNTLSGKQGFSSIDSYYYWVIKSGIS